MILAAEQDAAPQLPWQKNSVGATEATLLPNVAKSIG